MKLHQSNVAFTLVIYYINDIIMPVKRYAERMICLCETLIASNAFMAKQITN